MHERQIAVVGDRGESIVRIAETAKAPAVTQLQHPGENIRETGVGVRLGQNDTPLPRLGETQVGVCDHIQIIGNRRIQDQPAARVMLMNDQFVGHHLPGSAGKADADIITELFIGDYDVIGSDIFCHQKAARIDADDIPGPTAEQHGDHPSRDWSRVEAQ